MDSATVNIRPGRADDFDRVVEMTREVWGGTDYVPFVWDKWTKQDCGIVLVAERDRQVVGFQNQYLQDANSAWIEGIRVADESRGQGIAQKLLRAGIKWAQWQGCTRCRLTTSSENVASNRIAEAAGFMSVASFDILTAQAQHSDV